LEQRIKFLAEDKEKCEKQVMDKWQALLDEKESVLAVLDQKLRQAELSLKLREDEGAKKASELEKLNALLEQKLQLTERELVKQRQLAAQREQELRDLNRELYAQKREAQQLQNQVQRVEQNKEEELRLLRSEFEHQLAQAQNPQVGSDDQQQQKWTAEKEGMQLQLRILTETLESQKKIQESLL